MSAASDQEFLTLAGDGHADTRVQGSRFHAIAFAASTEDEARKRLEERERAQYDASHHCAAWRLRNGMWRALDAGEPSGSAGPPILAAIDAAGLQDAAVIVTRYFGGTKLGVGGLIRAYGDAAAAAIEQAPRRLGVAAVRATVRYPYDLTSVVMRAVERVGAIDVDHGYGDAGERAAIHFVFPASDLVHIRGFLQEQSAGSLTLEVDSETTIYRVRRG